MGYFKGNTNDAPVRKFGIDFVKERFGYLYENHPNRFAIDLINPINENEGAEMEAGSWSGDFWSNKSYYSISGVEEPTVNIPIRKRKYWYDNIGDTFIPNKKKYLFIRANKDFTQAIVIKPRTIKDEKKVIWTEFTPSNSTDGTPEKWMSFRRCHVDTYNLKKGKWVLERKKK